MAEKAIPLKKNLTKFNVPPIPKEPSDKEDVKVTNSKFHRLAKVRRAIKLPRLKLADLVVQVTEENTQRDIYWTCSWK